ncbi:LysR family transcriptional regulator [Sphingobium sp. BYY-5]|uniref:LysR family transcriptional regulator n=1 Tax=Sphingobium sp. BYY-5 TaxID=2926400 RepID=UPI001FA779EA|nr:LysR family transcriptional regulator [Sphingobium sp. BYY-5]MCI4590309.1 LysR family transcriptional regulator [Sphingobium sp. BYY-5]
MDQHPTPNPPAPDAPAFTDRARWTPDRQRLFLATLLATGNVTQAARAAGMSRASAHRLRRRLVGTPFDRTWAGALALHAQRLADPFAADPAQTVTQPARR